MLPFFLYLLTAVATGFQAYWQIMWAVWGKPILWQEAVAFFSALGLLAVAFVALFSARRACQVGLLCLAGLWVYYVPAVTTSLAFLTTEGLARGAIVFAPPLLLIASTVHMLRYLVRLRRGVSSSLLFPGSGDPNLGRRVLLVSSILFVASCLTLFLFTGVDKKTSTTVSWEILENEGKQFARFRFKDLAGFSGSGAETDSNEVIQLLRTKRPPALSLGVILTYDFGKVRSLDFNVMYIGGLSFHPQGLGHFGPNDPLASRGR